MKRMGLYAFGDIQASQQPDRHHSSPAKWEHLIKHYIGQSPQELHLVLSVSKIINKRVCRLNMTPLADQ